MNKKLGYYLCGGIEFDSKIQAAIYATKSGKEITWVFNDQVFKNYDWKIEPELSIDQLYDLRARQLRNDYDYIILSYSGGSDSHNIYESFRRQGLHIDEVLVNTMERASENILTVDVSNKNAYNAPLSEHKLNAVQRLEEIKQALPQTKITVLDLSNYLFESLEEAGDASWTLQRREGINPIGMTRFNYLYFKEVRNKLDKDKKIAVILGIEKPRTMITSKGRFALVFPDRSTNIITISEHLREYGNTTVEFFYWGPECASMIAKQGHIIKRWLEAFPEKQLIWTSKAITDLFRTVHEPILRNLLYTTWNNNWFQADKAVSDWHSEFDRWFIDHYSDSTAFKVWQEGINYIKTNVGADLLKFNPNLGIIDGLKGYKHMYDMGAMKVLHPTIQERILKGTLI